MERETQTQKHKTKFSKIIVCIMLAAVAIFTVTMIVIFMQQDAVPDTLITCFFAFCGGEAGVLGWIKCNDNKYDNTDACG